MKSSITRMNSDSDMSFLQKEGILIYPVYCLVKKSWYIEVNLQKRFPNKKPKAIILYDSKPIGNRTTLLAKELKDPMIKTYSYWRKKI